MNLEPRTLNCRVSNTLATSCVSTLALILVLSVRAAFGQEVRPPGEVSQGLLIAGLASGDEERRFDAVAQLGAVFEAAPNSATPQTIGGLTNALRLDSSPIVRALSARVFGICCSQNAVPILLESLTGEREIAVRKAIIYALARYRSSQITSTLIALLKDKALEIRGAASFALAEIGDVSSLNALSEILQKRQNDEDTFARSQAARALGKIGDRSVIEVLINSIVHDKSPEVRREAVRALGSLANNQDAKVIAVLRDTTLQADPYLAAVAREVLDKVNTRNP